MVQVVEVLPCNEQCAEAEEKRKREREAAKTAATDKLVKVKITACFCVVVCVRY